MSQSSETAKVNADSNATSDAVKPDDSYAATAQQHSAKQPAHSSGKGLAILALLFGLGGLGAGAWSVLQIQAASDLSAQQQQQLSNMRGQTTDLAEREQQLSKALAQMPSASQLQQGRELLANVQAEQQRLAQRLETVLGASRQDWRLAEAEHLLRMASLRLSALHDTNSARFLLQAADQILMEQDDPAAFAAREQLAKSISALQSSGTLDRTGLFVRLGALHQQASALTPSCPRVCPRTRSASAGCIR